MNTLWQKLTFKNYYSSNTDVVLQIMEEIRNLENRHLNIRIQHVKGYQDKVKPFDELTREAQLSLMADELATEAQKMSIPEYKPFPANQVTLQIAGQAITAEMTHHLRHAYLSQNMQEYLVNKHNWKQHVPDLI